MTDERDHLDIGPVHAGIDLGSEIVTKRAAPTLVIHHEADGAITLISDEPVKLVEVYERLDGPPVQRARQVMSVGCEFLGSLLTRATGSRHESFINRARTAINGGRPKLSVVRSKP